VLLFELVVVIVVAAIGVLNFEKSLRSFRDSVGDEFCFGTSSPVVVVVVVWNVTAKNL